MEKKTIDHLMRSTWQAIARMYNEEASKYNSTMATGFALLSIDPKKELLQQHSDLKWEWKQLACPGH